MKKIFLLLSLSMTSFCFGVPTFTKDQYAPPPPPPLKFSLLPQQYHTGEHTVPFYLTAAYTYYVPYQEGLNLYYSEGTADIPGNVIPSKMQGRSGFIIGFGVNTYHDGWLAEANYLWFFNDPHTEPNGLIEGLDDYESPFTSQDLTIDSLNSKFINYFNRLDLKIYRSTFFGNHFVFSPFGGILSAWENQYLNVDGTISSIHVGDIEQFRFKQEWWGIGAYGGSKATYYLPMNFGFYVSSGMSILLTNHKATEIVRRVNSDYVFQSLTKYNYNELINVEPMLEATLGLDKSYFWKNIALKMDIAWNFQTYFSHNGLSVYYSPTGVMGNYSMQGLIAAIRLNF